MDLRGPKPAWIISRKEIGHAIVVVYNEHAVSQYIHLTRVSTYMHTNRDRVFCLRGERVSTYMHTNRDRVFCLRGERVSTYMHTNRDRVFCLRGERNTQIHMKLTSEK
eukprot:TRINITY_DN18334_c0_g1_i1.p3 TRINITY_DN18334_c0_g1~~TRINITY_DN18334_c0_g1_i1.p3  ORF type:complete len:108 (+),score=2.65 TRINITY_DN18334_c0_g1_i1:251-574(+)